MPKKTDYPECAKISANREESRKIGNFIEWLQETGRFIGKRDEDDCMDEESLTIENLLAEYFGIDMAKVEEERQQMLESMQASGG